MELTHGTSIERLTLCIHGQLKGREGGGGEREERREHLTLPKRDHRA